MAAGRSAAWWVGHCAAAIDAHDVPDPDAQEIPQ